MPTTTKPTRVSNNSASLIDHIWSSEIRSNIDNFIIFTDITDHFPVVSRFKECTTPAQPASRVYKRVFSSRNVESFVDGVARLCWGDVLRSGCPNAAFDIFSNKFNQIFHINFPFKCIKQRTSSNAASFLTPGLIRSIKEKHRLARLASKWPITYKERYKKYRNLLTTILRNAKNDYHKNQLKNNQGNTKESWKIINHILGRSRQSNNLNINLNSIPCLDTANAFNDHFINIVDNVSHAEDSLRNFRSYLNPSPLYSLYLVPCTVLEIKNYINSLKSNSAGYDEITATLLKQTVDHISIPLTHILNLSFRHGVFPARLKIAKSLPLYKSGCKSDINNYRLISILPAISKIFEKAIVFRLSSFLENNNLLSNSQFGFRKNVSTQSALLNFVSKVYSELDKKSFVASVFLDISKAFDSLNHNILLTK